MKKLLTFAVLCLTFTFTSCDKLGNFQEQANQQFGDQHFKTALALIELHRLRYGMYPETLDSLKFTGQWDQIIKRSVRYEKLDSGYNLDLVNGWVGKPQHLQYPDEFWQGLGLQHSNLKK